MATKTANVLARVEPDVKEQAEAINAPTARDEMDAAAFDAMMGEGLAQAKAGQGVPLNDAFSLLYRGPGRPT